MEKTPSNENTNTSKYTKTQRVLAWIGIAVLAAFTILDIVLALCGAPTNYIMLCLVITILVPLILYFFIMMLKKRHPDSDIHVPGEKW